MSKNIFDLTSKKIKGEKVEFDKNPPTDEEKKKILADMFELKSEYWPRLPPRSRIAYIKKDGEFSRGGYTKDKPWFNKSGTWSVKMGTSWNEKQSSNEWVINFENIDKLFKEINGLIWIEVAMIRDATDALNRELRNVKTLLAENHELKRRAEKRKSVEVRMRPRSGDM